MMGQWTKNRAKIFFPYQSSPFKFPQRGECRCESELEDGVLESLVPALRAESQEHAGQPQWLLSLEVTQKLPGPANLFLSQIISLAKTLTRNCTLNWGGNGCQRWSAYPFPFLRETTFVVLATNMDQGCLLHFTKIQSSPRPTCSF